MGDIVFADHFMNAPFSLWRFSLHKSLETLGLTEAGKFGEVSTTYYAALLCGIYYLVNLVDRA